MKTFQKIIVFIQIVLIIFILINIAQVNTFASSSINVSNSKVANVAVLLYSFDDPYMLEIKKSLEDIENQNKDKVHFTFYDGKNNVAIQNETIDSLRKSNIDLFILKLVDTKEETIKNIMLNIKNVPIIFMEVAPEVVSNVSKLYSKAVFLYSTSSHEGVLQGRILVDKWNTDKKVLDKNNDNILQYILLKGEANNPYAIERTNDVISTINGAGIQTEQLTLVNANWFRELAKTSVNNLFLKYDGKIEAIIANNDAMALGAIDALQKYGYNKGDRNKNITVVGIDGLEEAKNLIDKGLMTGTLIQNTKMVADAFYNIGINLINNENPIANTPYKLDNGIITIPESYKPYTGPASTT
ncbi:galactose ABC transporter substrate-binding protein [Clostridium beijerinckii]|uniref:D-galactose/methyl-galactoside binding periplasmic protein MglB n=1 Tax=Clostridium beijerinckii TaxID=1520 RepID=A0AAE5LPY4_CLOBE|nr:galactose ABC transporter substrate-binding protein [Clostridium beijerinckii]NSB14300.1 methyl-galactoside transport system substrate-binding protein [Clostridium beijerinckii]OOM23906.1 D-galactose-binding periplasmic protein precursor [Clostridium beijerinckii]